MNTTFSPSFKFAVAVVVIILLGAGSYLLYDGARKAQVRADEANSKLESLVAAINQGQLLQLLSQQAANVQRCGKVVCE